MFSLFRRIFGVSGPRLILVTRSSPGAVTMDGPLPCMAKAELAGELAMGAKISVNRTR